MQRFKNSHRFINDLSVTIPFSIAKNNKRSAMSKVRHQSARLTEKDHEHQRDWDVPPASIVQSHKDHPRIDE
jgi:hypothetical protein